ncbi:hypothetical protein [Nocardia altamirensis]|uniref:hypothetical protein n=1 Tax=Nocardia altamirensis TaxID=472158 RepID=UPI001C3FCDE4|nr:hypothetical protein [Nocardia altamirensis]
MTSNAKILRAHLVPARTIPRMFSYAIAASSAVAGAMAAALAASAAPAALLDGARS